MTTTMTTNLAPFADTATGWHRALYAYGVLLRF